MAWSRRLAARLRVCDSDHNDKMTIPFTKMHGLGNDYVYVDAFRHPIPVERHAPLARAVSDRHRGIGSDGLILIGPPRPGVAADVRMEMYNADGSRGEMCGNGIRCVAKYAIEHGLAGREQGGGDARTICIETDRGVLETTCFLRGGRVERVRVDMGPPILNPRDIPVAAPGECCIQQPLQVGEQRLTMTCVSMGNPHAVFFVEDVAAVDLTHIGPLIERHAAFPNRVNAHFAQLLSRREAIMRTWERGSGITQACGTGACAVLVAGVLEDRLDTTALLHLPGGDLEIEWLRDSATSPSRHSRAADRPSAFPGHDWPGSDASDESNPGVNIHGHVFKTGPAVEVFSGVWNDLEDTTP